MEEITPQNSTRAINQGSVIAVSARYEGEDAIMAAAWNMCCGKNPPSVVVALGKRHHTSKVLLAAKKFVVNVVSSDQVDVINYVGRISGNKEDKCASGKFKFTRGSVVDAAVLDGSIAVLECEMAKAMEYNAVHLVVGHVKKCMVNRDMWNFEENHWIDNKAKMLFHLGGTNFCTNKAI